MKESKINIKHTFYAIGLSYQKADAKTRGKFSLDKTAKQKLLEDAKTQGYSSLMVLSTCNRTEIYGFAEHPFQLIKLLTNHTEGSLNDFENIGFVYKGAEAINHIFKVGTGLDSQIIGDFEIIGQLKTAFILSKKMEMTDSFLERLANSVIQASKRIKNETGLSSGATSVSFASVHYILNEIENAPEKKITLFGTGKIGQNTVDNLVKHTKNKSLTLINRTKNKAEKIANKFDLVVKDFEELASEIKVTDILIVATGAQKPTVTKDLIPPEKPLYILDLSVPKNVDEEVAQMENVQLIHMDELSTMTNKTLVERKKYIPQAHQIIEELKDDFTAWQESRKFVPTIKALKQKLSLIKEAQIEAQKRKGHDFDEEQAELIGEKIVKKIMNKFASHLREDGSEESLELMQNVFHLEDLIDEKNH